MVYGHVYVFYIAQLWYWNAGIISVITVEHLCYGERERDMCPPFKALFRNLMERRKANCLYFLSKTS